MLLKKLISFSYDEILNVAHLFYQLNEDAKADLELGVSKIVEEEIKQGKLSLPPMSQWSAYVP